MLAIARAAWIVPLACALAALTAQAGPRDPLYRWSDAAGAVRYTTERERIPPGHRDTASIVEAPRAGAAAPRSAPAPFREGPPTGEGAPSREAPAGDAAAPEPAAGTDGP
jgi:hypothetical protein